MPGMVFRSKIDVWLAVVLAIAALACLSGAVQVLFSDARSILANALVLVLLGAVLPLWILLGTRYTLDDSELRIVSGPFRWRIPFHEIRSIKPTRNPLSSPALSLDRLRIEYGRGKWIMVSPRDKVRFLRELESRQGVLHN